MTVPNILNIYIISLALFLTTASTKQRHSLVITTPTSNTLSTHSSFLSTLKSFSTVETKFVSAAIEKDLAQKYDAIFIFAAEIFDSLENRKAFTNFLQSGRSLLLLSSKLSLDSTKFLQDLYLSGRKSNLKIENKSAEIGLQAKKFLFSSVIGPVMFDGKFHQLRKLHLHSSYKILYDGKKCLVSAFQSAGNGRMIFSQSDTLCSDERSLNNGQFCSILAQWTLKKIGLTKLNFLKSLNADGTESSPSPPELDNQNRKFLVRAATEFFPPAQSGKLFLRYFGIKAMEKYYLKKIPSSAMDEVLLDMANGIVAVHRFELSHTFYMYEHFTENKTIYIFDYENGFEQLFDRFDRQPFKVLLGLLGILLIVCFMQNK